MSNMSREFVELITDNYVTLYMYNLIHVLFCYTNKVTLQREEEKAERNMHK